MRSDRVQLVKQPLGHLLFLSSKGLWGFLMLVRNAIALLFPLKY